MIMKRLMLLLMFVSTCSIVCAQQQVAAEKLVQQGIQLHDKGDYDGAITKYDAALLLDEANLFALAEKALTLLTAKKFDESVKVCKIAIRNHPGEAMLNTIYLTYGNALDEQKQTDKALDIYDEGIKKFPTFYQLYFNKAITLERVMKHDESLTCLHKSVSLKPNHPGSHNLIARIQYDKNQKIPSLMAYCRFMTLEPLTDRAKENLTNIQTLMKGNVEKTGDKSITINVDPATLAKPTETSFSSQELMLQADAALDFDPKYANKTTVEQFIRKLDNVCASLKESKASKSGFYWDYYAPYFIDMKDKQMVETFSYIAFASSNMKDVSAWLNTHTTEIQKFFDWSKAFVWNKV
jgi:tetratricopeptide (TPR) repeat protein